MNAEDRNLLGSRSEQLFAAFMDSLPGFAWMKDLEGRYVYANAMLAQLEPYRAGWLGKTDADLWPVETADTFRTNDEMVIATGKPLQTVERSIRNGENFYALVSKFPIFDSTGAVEAVGGTGIDITEKKKAEERLWRSEEKFKAVFGIAPVGISVLDRQRNVVDANPALEQILRLSKKKLLNGTWRRRAYLNADGTPRPPSELPSESAITENRIINDAETGVIAENGEIIWTQVSVAPLELPDASAVVITQDITDRKRAAKKLEEANHRLRSLARRLFVVQEEERRHLARELHDEIGQALTAAKLNLQWVTANGDSATLARLQETSVILDRLLGQVRQISLDLHPPMLDNLGLVAALRSLLDQQGRRALVAVRFSANDIPENLDQEIQTTCFRIAQEAITNTLRHANATRIDLDLGYEHDNLRLKIGDNGSGFDVERVEDQAVGLGLLGIKERATLAGGRAEIISSPNKGTTIDVSLPLKPRAERKRRHTKK